MSSSVKSHPSSAPTCNLFSSHSCSHILSTSLCDQHWQYFIFDVFSNHHQEKYACVHDLLIQCAAYTIPHREVSTASSTCKGSCTSTSFSTRQASPTDACGNCAHSSLIKDMLYYYSVTLQMYLMLLVNLSLMSIGSS